MRCWAVFCYGRCSSLYAPFKQGFSGVLEKVKLLRMVRKTGIRSIYNADTLPHSLHEFAIALFDEKMCTPACVASSTHSPRNLCNPQPYDKDHVALAL